MTPRGLLTVRFFFLTFPPYHSPLQENRTAALVLRKLRLCNSFKDQLPFAAHRKRSFPKASAKLLPLILPTKYLHNFFHEKFNPDWKTTTYKTHFRGRTYARFSQTNKIPAPTAEKRGPRFSNLRPTFSKLLLSDKSFWSQLKLGLAPIAGVSPLWLFWSRQT